MKFRHPKMIDLTEQVPFGKKLPDWLVEWGEKKLGLHALNVAHEHIENDWESGSKENFFLLACRYLNLLYELEGVENIPREGPCVIVSNHPHGMSDGLMFGDVVLRARDDIRIVVNEFLHCVRGMRPYEITVDVYGGEAAKRANMAGMREILRWLKDGHCILVFPSGSAATFSPKDGRVIDDPWQENIAAIIRKTNATVVPMNISGRTSTFFQVVSVLARGLRPNFLPREILRDGRTLHRIRLGKPVLPVAFEGRSDAQLSDYLRLRSMLLRYNEPESLMTQAKASPILLSSKTEPIAPPEDAETLSSEIASLPEECLCYKGENNPFCVYAATAERIPHMMKQIGRERERTFRAVGEGTGKASDTDRYDLHYVHLIMWDSRERRLAGAYRIGRSDLLLEQQGVRGIYNSAFFRFSSKFCKMISRGLEMGRAFITPEYQRQPASLDTLWMGIGRYLNKHPHYRYLYGTVSISRDYSFASRSLILSFLRENCMHREIMQEVKACFPPKGVGLRSEDQRLLASALPDVRALSSMVSEIEGNGMGIPVLLKQYLRLGGRMVSFGIDNDFGGVLDCLVVVELDKTPERIRQRYKGKDYMSAEQIPCES